MDEVDSVTTWEFIREQQTLWSGDNIGNPDNSHPDNNNDNIKQTSGSKQTFPPRPCLFTQASFTSVDSPAFCPLPSGTPSSIADKTKYRNSTSSSMVADGTAFCPLPSGAISTIPDKTKYRNSSYTVADGAALSPLSSTSGSTTSSPSYIASAFLPDTTRYRTSASSSTTASMTSQDSGFDEIDSMSGSRHYADHESSVNLGNRHALDQEPILRSRFLVDHESSVNLGSRHFSDQELSLGSSLFLDEEENLSIRRRHFLDQELSLGSRHFSDQETNLSLGSRHYVDQDYTTSALGRSYYEHNLSGSAYYEKPLHSGETIHTLLEAADLMKKEYQLVKPAELALLLKAGLEKYLLIDCRSFLEFNTSHIQQSTNISCSKIVKRRLQRNKIHIRELLVQTCHIDSDEYLDVIVYDQCTENPARLTDDNFLAVLLNKLTSAFNRVAMLKGECMKH